MISVGYLGKELRRRWSRTLVTALGLAAGVGLVMGIMGVSNGLTAAQNQALSPLSTVGTDVIVTRTVAPASASSSTASPSASPSASTRQPQGGGGFFGPGAGGSSRGGAANQINDLNATDQAALLNANSSILTDLSKLGPAGTAFTHDFFVPGTLITFPDAAVQDVAKVEGVQSAVPGLSLQALRESGTVPALTDTVTTGGQTLTAVARPAPLTDAEQAQVRACIQASGEFTPPAPGSGTRGSGGFPRTGGANSAFTKCLPERYQQYEAQVVVPEQTITRILNPPQTDTQSKTYTVAGVNPSDKTTGLITVDQVVSGSWFTSKPANEILVNTAYASTNGIKAGQTLAINGSNYTVVGLVTPTLTGNISDIYFDLNTLQAVSTNANRVNEVLVKVTKSSNVDAVAAAIQKQLPGAQVLTAKSLANQVTGSLANAQSLANTLGGALAIIILLAAFLIAALLTMSSVAKRVREIGTLRAIGWSRGRVVRQIMAETVGIGIIGAVVGVVVGLGVCGAVDAFGPTLNATTSGLNVGASTVNLFHQSSAASVSQNIHMQALLNPQIVLIGIAAALVGGVIAGTFGGWRASRLAPASALRDLG